MPNNITFNSISDKKNWPWVNCVDSKIYTERIKWPKISIVTPSYNQGQYIEETILSVINQNYPNIEFIIIDGASTDQTLSIIKKYEPQLKFWVSEKDNGQVDAIIKGLKYCTGDIFNWINSDDLLDVNALYNIAEAYIKNNNLKIIAGGCTHFSINKNENETTLVRDLTFNGLISERSYFQQPSQWIAIKNVKDLNINPNLHFSFDWGMILNFNLKESEINYLPINLSYFREHETAKTFKNGLLFKYEKLIIVKIYLKKTKNIVHKIILANYIFKLDSFLKIVKRLEKQDKDSFSEFLFFGFRSPSLFLIRFYLGHLKTLFFEKKN